MCEDLLPYANPMTPVTPNMGHVLHQQHLQQHQQQQQQHQHQQQQHQHQQHQQPNQQHQQQQLQQQQQLGDPFAPATSFLMQQQLQQPAAVTTSNKTILACKLHATHSVVFG